MAAARYYTHQGAAVVNRFLRHGTSKGLYHETQRHEEERVALSQEEQKIQGRYRAGELDRKGLKAALARLGDLGDRLHADGLKAHDHASTIKDMVPALDRFIAARPLKHDVTLYRGANFTREALAQLRTGAVILDRGYVSTTVEKNLALSFAGSTNTENVGVLFKIRGRHGQHAADMREVGYVGEAEFLIPRGSKFLVTGSRKTTNGHEVECEIV